MDWVMKALILALFQTEPSVLVMGALQNILLYRIPPLNKMQTNVKSQTLVTLSGGILPHANVFALLQIVNGRI
jgi:hypothetical protein